ncbi:MAG: type IV pilus modification protein PilV [Gammaproteobacteria bacterium]|nr:type IV pilus modification protein PilV [Gammaproteobacteria bacterium]
MKRNRHFPKVQHGATLVEILITVVLVSIGLLGLAGLQLATVQNTNSAAQRFEATTLAWDILERMRANRQRALNGDYDIAPGEVPAAAGRPGEDLDAWVAALATLPNGQGGVDVDGGVVTIQVLWTDISDDNPADTREALVQMRTEL